MRKHRLHEARDIGIRAHVGTDFFECLSGSARLVAELHQRLLCVLELDHVGEATALGRLFTQRLRGSQLGYGP